MYVERIPNRNSPPAILLRESYREGDKIKKRTLANLSDWPAAKIEALRRVLRNEAVASATEHGLTLMRSLPHGHVAAVLGTLRKLGLDGGLAQGGRQPARAVARHDNGPCDRPGLEACDGARARRRDGELLAGHGAATRCR